MLPYLPAKRPSGIRETVIAAFCSTYITKNHRISQGGSHGFFKNKEEPHPAAGNQSQIRPGSPQAYTRICQTGNNADKGLVTVIVENVKIFPAGEYCYKLLLAGIKKEQQVYHLLGSIVLSSGGRGEGTFRIRPADLNGHGSCLWEFDTMIVAAASVTNPREALHPVLQGKFRIACPADPHPTAAPKDYSPFYQDFVLDRCITIARMQKQLTDIRPFYHDSTSAHWKKVLDWSDFPILSPGSETPVKIYGHFLWG